LTLFTVAQLDTSQIVENIGGQSIAEPRKIEKIAINYARVAKIVDVKALKRNMWRQLVDDNGAVRIQKTLAYPDLFLYTSN
jgi:hypothetical protein